MLSNTTAISYPWIARRQWRFSTTWLSLIGLAVGLIGFSVAMAGELAQRERIGVELNSFVSDLLYARAEAAQRAKPIAICASSDGASCSGSNDWGRGWIVFRDIGDNAIPSAGAVLRRRSGWSGTDTFTASAAAAVLRVNASGMVHDLEGGTLTLALHTSPADDASTRCVTLNQVGHHTLQAHGTGACR